MSTVRSVVVDHLKDIGGTNIFLICLLAFITVYPLLFGGFTNYDDVRIAINNWSGRTWDITKISSIFQGRFQYFWTIPLWTLPFIVDTQAWYLVIKFGSFFATMGAMYYAIIRLFKSRFIAITAVIFFLSIIQNGWEYNGLTSYPLLFNFLITMFLLSLGLFATAIDKKNIRLAYVAGLLYFFSLGTEVFVLFSPFFIGVLLSRMAPNISVMVWLRSHKRYILAIILPVVIYIVIYFIWRQIHPSTYDGNSLQGFGNLWSACRVIMRYSFSAFPLSSLHLYTAAGDPLSVTGIENLRQLFTGLNALHIIKPAVVGFLFTWLLTAKNFIIPRSRTLLIGALFAGIGIFLPNLLLGFSLKYQRLLDFNAYSFVYTYYSFICAVIFLALILAYISTKSRTWHTVARIAFISTTVAIMMILSFVVEVRNQHIAFDQKLAERKWQMIDVVMQSPMFLEIPDGSTIVAPTLFSMYRGNAEVLEENWSDYIKYKTGKQVQFDKVDCKSNTSCYVLVFRQMPDSDNQFILLGKKIQPGSDSVKEFTVYALPVRENTVMMGSFISNISTPSILVNGESIPNVGATVFSVKFPQDSRIDNAQVARVYGNVDFVLEKTTLSQYSIEPQLVSLKDQLAQGINFGKDTYPEFLREVLGISGQESWGRWTDANLSPSAKFSFKQSLPKKFTLEMEATILGPNIGVPIIVRVGSVQKTFVITKPDVYSLIFKTDGSADSIEIISPHPFVPHEVDPNNPDTRKLGIGLVSLKIK